MADTRRRCALDTIDGQRLSLAVGSIAIAPSSPSTVYVGTGEGNDSGDSYAGVGLYRIDNADSATPTLVGPIDPLMTLVVNGVTYTNVPIFNRRSIVALAVDPANAGTVYVGTNDFNDQGLGKTIRREPLPTVSIGRLTGLQPYAVTFIRPALSTDSYGKTGTEISDLVLDPANSDHLMVAYSTSTAGSGVLTTDDAT